MVALRPVLLKTGKKHYRNGFVREKCVSNDIFRWDPEAHCRSFGYKLWIWHIGCNLQSQVSIGQYTNLEAQANLNNCGTGQIN